MNELSPLVYIVYKIKKSQSLNLYYTKFVDRESGYFGWKKYFLEALL